MPTGTDYPGSVNQRPPVADFSLTTTTSDAETTVAIDGEVDLYTAPQLRATLYDLIADGALHLTLDLRDLSFIDSSGLGVIVGTLKRIREGGGELVLQAPSRSTRKVLDITGLSQVIRTID
jgi:anti-sigma B factor antagonist